MKHNRKTKTDPKKLAELLKKWANEDKNKSKNKNKTK